MSLNVMCIKVILVEIFVFFYRKKEKKSESIQKFKKNEQSESILHERC